MSDPLNPWLSRPTTPPPTDAAPVVAAPTLGGPTAPQRGVTAPDQVDQLPIRDQSGTAALWWVGAHGGAGETTMAGLVPTWQATRHSWPRATADAPAQVVLVARSNAAGLRAAQAAMRQWAAGLVPSVDVLGLVVLADAPGRLPRSLRDLLQVVSGGVPRTWSVPWVESWRVGEPPALTNAPREAQRLVDELYAILGTGAAGTTNER